MGEPAVDRTAGVAGALSRISQATVLDALRVPRTGKVYDLGLELNDVIPSNPAFTPLSLTFTHTPEATGANSPFQFSADTFAGGLHIGTHMDAFIHVQAENRIYGGSLAREVRTDRGWTQYGMETVAPMVGRGVFLDIPTLRGRKRLDDGYEITIADLKAELARTRQAIRTGDFVLVRTGKIQDWGDAAAFQAAEPGVGRDAAIWLYEAGMAEDGRPVFAMEFIRGLPHSPKDQLVVKALVGVVRGMGRSTIAEFVGDEPTLSLLADFGVDYAQGFLLGRPHPVLPLAA